MLTRRECLCAVLGAILAGCAGGKPRQFATAPPFAQLPPEDQAIYRALFHHMFAHWQGSSYGLPMRFFLRFNRWHELPCLDAPEDFLAELRAEGFDVRPGSQFRMGRGIECSVGRFERVSKGKVRMFGGYLFGTTGGEWGDFQMEKKEGRWVVVSWKPEEFA